MGFEAKEGEIEKELVQQLNIVLLQGQMRLCAKVVVATQQRPMIVLASTPVASVCPSGKHAPRCGAIQVCNE
jgi:hypothetical protein